MITGLLVDSFARFLLYLDEPSQRRQAELASLFARGEYRPFDTPALVSLASLHLFVPKWEPLDGEVEAVFVEPGALHVVYRDEVFPLSKAVDASYRELRREQYGRTMDIETVYVDESETGGTALFETTSAGINPYETNWHFTDRQPWSGALYKTTWNGLMTTRPAAAITLRGGYRESGLTLYYGAREDAEAFARL